MASWNLPVMEATGSPSSQMIRQGFDAMVATAPPFVSRPLRQLIENRKTKFAGVPFLVILRVEGTSLEDLRLVAEARMPESRR